METKKEELGGTPWGSLDMMAYELMQGFFKVEKEESQKVTA